jgi:hypothetical protein
VGLFETFPDSREQKAEAVAACVTASRNSCFSWSSSRGNSALADDKGRKGSIH